MQMPQIKVDGIMVVALLAVVAGIYLYTKREKIIEAVNPTDPNNLANKAFNAITDPLIPGDESLGAWCADNKSNPVCWGFVVADKLIPQ